MRGGVRFSIGWSITTPCLIDCWCATDHPSPLAGEGQGGGGAYLPGQDGGWIMASSIARALRRNPTDAEQRLWSRLRRRQLDGCRFRREVPLGPYVVDFACLAARLVIEVDGGQHSWRAEEDATRSSSLEANGFRVLRFWNNDVHGNLEGVLETIRLAVQSRASDCPPHPDPPPQGGGRSVPCDPAQRWPRDICADAVRPQPGRARVTGETRRPGGFGSSTSSTPLRQGRAKSGGDKSDRVGLLSGGSGWRIPGGQRLDEKRRLGGIPSPLAGRVRVGVSSG
jgi:very-short-patch-repair endonuclease